MFGINWVSVLLVLTLKTIDMRQITDNQETDFYDLLYEREIVVVHSIIRFEGMSKGLEQVNEGIKMLKLSTTEGDLLSKIDSFLEVSWDKYKSTVIDYLELKRNYVTDKMSELFGDTHKDNKQREKRAINFLGNLISYVTGIPGPDEWGKNVQNIAELKKAIYLVEKIGKIRDEKIDMENHEIGKLQVTITAMLNGLSNLTRDNILLAEGLRSRLQFWTMENQIKNTQTAMELSLHKIGNIISEGRSNRAAVEGMSKNFLQTQIRKIETDHKILSPIVGSNDVKQYYDMPLALVARHGSDIWISLKIPLVNFNYGYRENTVPKFLTQTMHELHNMGASEPKWFRNLEGKHTFIGRGNLDKCIGINGIRLCHGREIMINTRENSSHIEFPEIWIETDRNNLIAYKGIDSTKGIIKCGKVTRDFELRESNIIELSRNFELSTTFAYISSIKLSEGLTMENSETYKILDYTSQGHLHNRKNRLDIDELWKKVHNFNNMGKLQNNLTLKTDELTQKLDDTLTNISEYHGTDWKFYLLMGTIGVIAILTIYVGIDIKRKMSKRLKKGKNQKRPSLITKESETENRQSGTKSKREEEDLKLNLNEGLINEIGNCKINSNMGNDLDKKLEKNGNSQNGNSSNYHF